MIEKNDLMPILNDLVQRKVKPDVAADIILALQEENETSLRNTLAKDFLCALLQNSERYKYVTKCYKKEKLTDEAANMKNINKAFHMADSFLKSIK